MPSWKKILLVFELFLFAVILVLPQVDLPDFTFHGGTAPAAVRAKLASSPIFPILIRAALGRLGARAMEFRRELASPMHPLDVQSRLSLACVLLC
jgi:hypothetical protein